MHARRWLTSIIVLPVLFYLLLRGPWWGWLALLLIVDLLAHWEFLRLSGPFPRDLQILHLTLSALLLLAFVPGLPQLPLAILLLSLFCFFCYFLLHFETQPQLINSLSFGTLGLLYLPLVLGHFYWLFELPGGRWWLFWLFGVIFGGDTGAFYAGRWWGKHKLYSAVSPGKTVAGAVGGLLASVAVGLGLASWLHPQYSIAEIAVLSALLAVVGQLGDLFESMLKRRAQIKDASQILPGHGGLLDRLDSLGFAGVFLYYFKIFLL